MKKLALLLVCFFAINGLYAQSSNMLLYGEIGGGLGNYGSLKGAVDVAFAGNNVLAPCFYFNSRHAPNTPSDYQPGFLSGFPHDQFEMFGLMYGKIIYTENPHVRVALRGGIMLGDYITPYDFEESTYLIGANYTCRYDRQFTGAILLNPVLELPFSRRFGFSVGLYSLLNDKSSTVGGEVNIIFGHVRERSLPAPDKKAK
jgi:hypothetical protein